MRVDLHTLHVSPCPAARKFLFYQERQIINKSDAVGYLQPQGASYQELEESKASI